MLLLLIMTWFGLTRQMAVPWFGHHDGNGAWISAAVRNYQRYDLATTRLIPATDYAPPADPAQLSFYTHHPPLIVWLSALSARMFGLSELALRWTAASLTLLSLAAFYALARRLLGVWRGLLAAALYGLMPMTLYFGRMPNHEPLALLVGLLFANVLLDWLRAPGRGHWLALALLCVAAAWSMWGAVMFVGVLGGAAFGLCLLRCQTRPAAQIAALGVVALLAVAGLMLYYEWGAPGAWERQQSAFSFRASDTIGYGDVRPFSWSEFTVVQFTDLLLNLTPGVLLVGVWGVFGLRREHPGTRLFAAALWTMALLYVLILRNAAQEHDFYKFFFVPAVALTAAVAVDGAWPRPRLRALVVVLLAFSLLAGFVYVTLLHQFARHPRPVTIRDSILESVQSDDALLTNIPLISLGMHYYLNRPVQTGVTPAQALATDRPALYVYCYADDETDLPPVLREYPSTRDLYCAYVRLDD